MIVLMAIGIPAIFMGILIPPILINSRMDDIRQSLPEGELERLGIERPAKYPVLQWMLFFLFFIAMQVSDLFIGHDRDKLVLLTGVFLTTLIYTMVLSSTNSESSHIRRTLALSRAAWRHDITAAREPAGRREPAKGVGSSAS